jgi:hypothetical protein
MGVRQRESAESALFPGKSSHPLQPNRLPLLLALPVPVGSMREPFPEHPRSQVRYLEGPVKRYSLRRSVSGEATEKPGFRD